MTCFVVAQLLEVALHREGTWNVHMEQDAVQALKKSSSKTRLKKTFELQKALMKRSHQPIQIVALLTQMGQCLALLLVVSAVAAPSRRLRNQYTDCWASST